LKQIRQTTRRVHSSNVRARALARARLAAAVSVREVNDYETDREIASAIESAIDSAF
jgi:hypothetical protein